MRLGSIVCLVLAACATTAPGGASDDGGPDTPDGSVLLADGAPLAPDAAPDSLVLRFADERVLVATGEVVTTRVLLGEPAGAGGVTVNLSSSDPAVTVPGSVFIPEGQDEASITLTAGGAVSEPLTVVASAAGVTGELPARVVPAVSAIGGMAGTPSAGQVVSASLNLAAPAPEDLTVTLAVGDPSVASVPASVVVPAGRSSVSFDLRTLRPGAVAVSAELAGSSTMSTGRVGGLELSEVLFDVASTDTGHEWIELRSTATVPVDLAGMTIRVATGVAGYTDALALVGVVPAGGCVVVGGPSSPGVTFLMAADFVPDLGNTSSGAADGIELVDGSGSVLDDVLYGGANSDRLPDETGAIPASADVANPGTDHSIERAGGTWVARATPNPGVCD